ncbi:MAG: LacI family transcriptional regulator [Ruminiclostridium sp.]|nr:LacI family transcriptional regulator [Ruminiclostridium sp.]
MPEFITIGKSKLFYNFLKNEILGGEYKPGDKFPSIRELAGKYGISKITVNSVISSLVTEGLLYSEQGKGTYVSENKRQPLRNKKMIGVMLFDFRLESDVEIGLFNGIQENLKDDYFIIPYNSYDNVDMFYKGLKGFMELDVDGIIMVPPSSEDYDVALIKRILCKDIPIVLINRKIPSLKADFFSLDFMKSTCRAVKYILSLGRKHILLAKHSSPSIGTEMCEGYYMALEEAGISRDRRCVVTWRRDGENAEDVLRQHIQGVDGIVASDFFIYKARKVIYESTKHIQKGLSIIGINDTVYSRFMNPPISAVPYPSLEIGKAAIEALTDRIENKREIDMEKTFDPEIIIRSS